MTPEQTAQTLTRAMWRQKAASLGLSAAAQEYMAAIMLGDDARIAAALKGCHGALDETLAALREVFDASAPTGAVPTIPPVGAMFN